MQLLRWPRTNLLIRFSSRLILETVEILIVGLANFAIIKRPDLIMRFLWSINGHQSFRIRSDVQIGRNGAKAEPGVSARLVAAIARMDVLLVFPSDLLLRLIRSRLSTFLLCTSPIAIYIARPNLFISLRRPIRRKRGTKRKTSILPQMLPLLLPFHAFINYGTSLDRYSN